MHYKITGNGKTIVLLHGFLEDYTIWDEIAQNLSKDFRLVLMDLPGHGKSPVLSDIHSMELMAEEVVKVLRTEQIEQSTLVGHSLGGYVALACLAQCPELFDGICLVNSTPESDNPERIENRNRAIQAIRQNKKLFIRMAIPNLFNQLRLEAYQSTVEKLVLTAGKMSEAAIVAAIEGMKIRPNRLETLAAFKGKKMWVIGKRDDILDAKKLKKIARHNEIPFVEFPDGHMSMIENATELTSVVEAFLG
jgi:pimeloyl-ACP methyl ester carboxylesterase